MDGYPNSHFYSYSNRYANSNSHFHSYSNRYADFNSNFHGYTSAYGDRYIATDQHTTSSGYPQIQGRHGI